MLLGAVRCSVLSVVLGWRVAPNVAPWSAGVMHLLDPSPDAPGETRQVLIRAPRARRGPREGGELLFLVRNAGRQRRDVPVDVPVSGLAAQAHDVEPLGGQLLADRFSHPVDQALQREILLDCEVAGDLLSVRSGATRVCPSRVL